MIRYFVLYAIGLCASLFVSAQAINHSLPPARARFAVHAQGFAFMESSNCISVIYMRSHEQYGFGASIWYTPANAQLGVAPCFYATTAFWKRWAFSYQVDLIFQQNRSVLFGQNVMGNFALARSCVLRAGITGLIGLLPEVGLTYIVNEPMLPVVGIGWQFGGPLYGNHLKMRPIKPCNP